MATPIMSDVTTEGVRVGARAYYMAEESEPDKHEYYFGYRILILNGGRIVADGTAAELAQQIVGEDEVRWTRHGQRFVQSTSESTRFVFDLFKQYGEAIADLEVRRSSLEDTYLALVRQAEAGPGDAAARRLEEVA